LATEYLDLDDAFDAYAEAVEVSVQQAKDALLNIGQLESALARPQNAAAYDFVGRGDLRARRGRR
jgi:hypothetical protein